MASSEDTLTSDTTRITWDPTSRIALVRYAPDARLTKASGAFLVDALTRWIGASRAPFAILADGSGLRGTDAEYRAVASHFFRQHRDAARVALIHLGPVIHVVVEMFRIGTGIQLKSFESEESAREWLRENGIAA